MVPAETKETRDTETIVKELLRKFIGFVSRSLLSKCNPVLYLQTISPLSSPTARFVKQG